MITRFRQLAESHGWLSVSGADIVEQICVSLNIRPAFWCVADYDMQYEQARLWTGLMVSSEGRRKVREALREHADVANPTA